MNHELIKGILLFLAGGAVGSMVTGFLCKRKIDDIEESFEDRISEEIEEVRSAIEEGYKKRKEIQNGNSEKNDDSDNEMDEEFLSEISHSIVDKANRARVKPDLMEQAKHIMENNNYVNYSNSKNEPEKNDIPEEDIVPLESPVEDIELIAPDEFGEISDYEQVNLYYLTRDKVLVDNEGIPVENVHAMIGDDALEEFGVYEPDAVFVRNNRYETDYAIFLKEETLANFSL